MKTPNGQNIKYLNISKLDEAWGIVVTTIGYQQIPPQSTYPSSQHPESHIFNPEHGRILKEYQLIYISKGSGYFESQSCKRQRIEPGTMILLFPDEWHTYQPDKASGWFEYWVGFRGLHIDTQIEKGFFSKADPIYKLGFSLTIISLYEDILNYASKEKSSYQQIISSIVFHILGSVYYKNRNAVFGDSLAVNKINEARAVMKQEIDNNISPETIANNIGVSYSWFRKKFKEYVDVSPAQYQANLRWLRSKELLDITEMGIGEIAYHLNFESVGHFSTFFRQREGVSPLEYRKRGRQYIKK